ncbi:MAG: acyl-CoA dehydrogenase [Acetobacteraceae bacterium]|nr:acyl-CoA dehydrogenase [Acetobacteraceae bacterium]
MKAALDMTGTSQPRGPAPAGDPVERAKAVAPLIAAAAPRIEAGRALTPDVLDALHGAALFRTLLPAACNGEEVPPAVFVRMQEVIAAADASTAWCIGQASGCSMAAAYMAPEVTWEIWGRDPRAVTAWGMGSGLAEVVDGGFRVTGTWRFASGSKHATWIGGHCQVRERDGSLRVGHDGKPIERTMMFRKDQVTMIDAWDVVGLRGTGSDSYSVQDLFVPEEYSVSRDNEAERRLPGTLYRFSTTHIYASGFAAVSMGIARAMLEALKSMAMTKIPAATTRLMRDSEVIQSGVAQAEAKLRSARAFLLEVLEESWEAVSRRGHVTLDEKVLIRLASTSAIHRAKEVAEWAYHEAGATAIFESEPFERRMRDIHAAGQQVQGRSAHLEVCGQHFLGMTPHPRFL